MNQIQVKQGQAIPMSAPSVATTVPNPKFMVRDDGVVLTFNQDIWNVDQRSKKRLRCVAHLPASYIRRLNEQRTREQQAAAAQRKYNEDFAAQQQALQGAALQSALDAQTTLQEISTENLVAEGELAGFTHRDPSQAFLLSTASKEDIIAYARDELHVPLDESQSAEILRREVAQMIGLEVPAELPPAVTVPPVVQTAPAAPPMPPRRPAGAIGAIE